MRRLFAAAAALAVVFGLAGCMAGMTLRSRQKYVATHRVSPEVREAILAGVICTGMTEEEVVASIGPPDHINRSTYSWMTTAQFCYGAIGVNMNFNRYSYVYFENGTVTGWDQ